MICSVSVSGVYGQRIPVSQFTGSIQESSCALANTEQVDAKTSYLFIYFYCILFFLFLLGAEMLSITS